MATQRISIFDPVQGCGHRCSLPPKTPAAFMDFTAKGAVPPQRYSLENLEEERQTAGRLEP